MNQAFYTYLDDSSNNNGNIDILRDVNKLFVMHDHFNRKIFTNQYIQILYLIIKFDWAIKDHDLKFNKFNTSIHPPLFSSQMSAIKRISEQALNHLRRTYTPSDFKPKFMYKNIWGRKRYMHPKVSLRKLADMRKNAECLGINTESIGLPPKKEKKPPRTKPPKGAKHERNAPER